MTTKLLTGAGVDIDTLFKPLTSTKIADVKIKTGAGVDISTLFEPRGTSPARADVKWKTGAGIDISTLFMDIGYAPPPTETIDLSTPNVFSSTTAGLGATAQYQLKTTGDIFGTNGGNAVADRGDWISPKTNMSDYSVKYSMVSGSVSSSPAAAGTYVQLGVADRIWTLSQPSLGSSSGVIRVTVRHDPTSTEYGPWDISLQAARTS